MGSDSPLAIPLGGAIGNGALYEAPGVSRAMMVA